MKDDRTDLVCIIDRSGSMGSILNDALYGFNTFLDAQKALPGEARLTYVQFDHEYERVHDRVPLADVPPLTRETYVPRGSTALFDALCRTIDAVGERLAATPEAERPAKVVVVVVTDGEENASRRYTLDDVQGRIAHQRDVYGWEFVFLAAHQDAMQGAVRLGMHKDDGIAFAMASPPEVHASYAVLNEAVAHRRTRR